MWNLFRDYGVAMSAAVQDHFKGFFKGTKRQLAAPPHRPARCP